MVGPGSEGTGRGRGGEKPFENKVGQKEERHEVRGKVLKHGIVTRMEKGCSEKKMGENQVPAILQTCSQNPLAAGRLHMQMSRSQS